MDEFGPNCLYIRNNPHGFNSEYKLGQYRHIRNNATKQVFT